MSFRLTPEATRATINARGTGQLSHREPLTRGRALSDDPPRKRSVAGGGGVRAGSGTWAQSEALRTLQRVHRLLSIDHETLQVKHQELQIKSAASDDEHRRVMRTREVQVVGLEKEVEHQKARADAAEAALAGERERADRAETAAAESRRECSSLEQRVASVRQAWVDSQEQLHKLCQLREKAFDSRLAEVGRLSQCGAGDQSPLGSPRTPRPPPASRSGSHSPARPLPAVGSPSAASSPLARAPPSPPPKSPAPTPLNPSPQSPRPLSIPPAAAKEARSLERTPSPPRPPSAVNERPPLQHEPAPPAFATEPDRSAEPAEPAAASPPPVERPCLPTKNPPLIGSGALPLPPIPSSPPASRAAAAHGPEARSRGSRTVESESSGGSLWGRWTQPASRRPSTVLTESESESDDEREAQAPDQADVDTATARDEIPTPERRVTPNSGRYLMIN